MEPLAQMTGRLEQLENRITGKKWLEQPTTIQYLEHRHILYPVNDPRSVLNGCPFLYPRISLVWMGMGMVEQVLYFS